MIDAHKGAVLDVKWNHDGTSLLTCGEDGALRIWSRSGMLRSNHAQMETPIYSAVWSPFSTSVAFCKGKILAVRAFNTNAKVLDRLLNSAFEQTAWLNGQSLAEFLRVESPRECRPGRLLVSQVESDCQRQRGLLLQDLGLAGAAVAHQQHAAPSDHCDRLVARRSALRVRHFLQLLRDLARR